MKPTLFLSDLHLSPERPLIASAFDRFCAGPARNAAAVYILGDLFDWWLGDDQLAEPFAASVADGLRGVTQAGVPVHVARGNRDFLLGDRFAKATGIAFLPEQQKLDIDHVATLVSHGDELCTADADYQRLRARLRSPATQRRVLRLPYFVRRLMALALRRRSSDATARKPEAILDVSEDAVMETFRRHAVIRLIHGHTHRPAIHHMTVDGNRCERIVLADWHDQGHFVAIGDGQLTSHEIAAS